ncbi:PAS domain-containing protein [Natronolimnobius sp. AArcel1]|uniref:sensor histidine kinase n=1 Tax=Natronolimnobius sp. AArcel1 TaxID=1679093 RepID=UPI0013EB81D4|nr:histidine kinase N-terminal 7TM domain-containing protein [Natronolimnobius sp. AArcel1]NGM70385.1 PAS domain-containing protein [Natronolimnobius sp. AArcel1]
MYITGLLAYAGSALIGGLLAVSLLVKYDRRQPAFTFGLFLLVIGFWATTYVGYLVATTEAWLLFFIQLSYLSVVTAPVVWVVFALQYTDREAWLSRRRMVFLSVVPASVLALVWTAPYHSWFYAEMFVRTVDGIALLETPPEIGHRINIVYSYGLLLIGTGLIVGETVTNNRLYRRQSLVLFGCLSAPWLANGLFHLGYQPIPTADLTPVVFVIIGIPLAAIVQRAELTGFVPVAHERVFHTLDNPVFVITTSNRILDANRAAQRLVDADGDQVGGRDLTTILPDPLLEGGNLHPELEEAMECVIEVDGVPRQYIARLRGTETAPQGNPRGCILSLTDITLQKRQQESLEAKNEQLERLASVVSHDLATPLATGENLLHLIKSDLDSSHSEMQQSLSDLETVHHRLRAFAEGLPALARESTDVETPIDCDLETVAWEAWEVVDTGDLRLSIDSTDTLQADPNRLQQAFENLFGNAAEHAVSGQAGATTVRIGRLPAASGFYLEDDGPGIPAGRREDLLAFGVSTGSGSGYGLAIVRTIVEAHGWSLSITDGAQGGTRFEIETASHARQASSSV